MKKYVIYRRVSTREQGIGGYGIDAQKRDINIYLETFSDVPYEIIGEFVEVHSASDDNRPELCKALDLVRKHKAELLVAKLDRLSRKVSFISKLMEDKKVSFRVATMPHADEFQLHIYAALAEQERKFISIRTKQGLKSAKDRGVKLGGQRPNAQRANAAKSAKADAEAKRMASLILPLREAGKTMAEIAESLNASGVTTARGGQWHPMMVKRVLDRVG